MNLDSFWWSSGAPEALLNHWRPRNDVSVHGFPPHDHCPRSHLYRFKDKVACPLLCCSCGFLTHHGDNMTRKRKHWVNVFLRSMRLSCTNLPKRVSKGPSFCEKGFCSCQSQPQKFDLHWSRFARSPFSQERGIPLGITVAPAASNLKTEKDEHSPYVIFFILSCTVCHILIFHIFFSNHYGLIHTSSHFILYFKYKIRSYFRGRLKKSSPVLRIREVFRGRLVVLSCFRFLV